MRREELVFFCKIITFLSYFLRNAAFGLKAIGFFRKLVKKRDIEEGHPPQTARIFGENLLKLFLIRRLLVNEFAEGIR